VHALAPLALNQARRRWGCCAASGLVSPGAGVCGFFFRREGSRDWVDRLDRAEWQPRRAMRRGGGRTQARWTQPSPPPPRERE
jgi:hypothetical protein